MALSEQRVLKSVEVLPQAAAVNVLWEDQVLRDGEVIATTPFRCAYTQEQKDRFLSEVEGAINYIVALGW